MEAGQTPYAPDHQDMMGNAALLELLRDTSCVYHPLGGGNSERQRELMVGESRGQGRRRGRGQQTATRDPKRQLYARIAQNQTAMKIYEGTGTKIDPREETYAGFRKKVLRAIWLLMKGPKGYGLISSLTSASHDIAIRPLHSSMRGEEPAFADAHDGPNSVRKADGTRGSGSATTVYLEPWLGNDTQKVHDEEGRRIKFPVFIVLGHELIHALRNDRGEGAQGRRTDSWYSNEEVSTIGAHEFDHEFDAYDIDENDLREEHNLTKRYGHGGRRVGPYAHAIESHLTNPPRRR